MTTAEIAPIQSRAIEELELTARATNALKNAGIATIGDLANLTPKNLQAVKNLGKKSVEEIQEKLGSLEIVLPPDPVVIDGTATDAGVAATPPAETAEVMVDPIVLDRRMCETAARISMNTLDLCADAVVAIRQKIWEGFGHLDAQSYFETRVGISSYRNMNRWISIHEALVSIPEGEARDAIRDRLAKLGVSKAAILAPIIERKEDMAPWLDRAEKSTLDSLQEAVSHHVGAKPRGPVANDPGGRFYRALLAQIPPDAQEEVREVFEAGMEVLENRNPIVAFLYMVKEVKVEWTLALERKRAGKGNA